MTETAAVRVQELEKTYHIGFFRKKVEAVRKINFEVRRGEVFGLLGPNGAGKTSTMKMLLGLVFANRGSIELFGLKPGDRDAMKRIGYMPENPYVYQYLKPLEFLDLCGRLMGMQGAERRRASMAIVERVGLAHALDRPIGKFSKGMTQRIGLAQALLHDPDLLILDEPMSGLDPIGRKEVRDIVMEQRAKGKTILFTSHILSDVELLCDRVAIVHKGKITAQGGLDELLKPEVRRVEIELESVSPLLHEALAKYVVSSRTVAPRTIFTVDGDHSVPFVLKEALQAEARIVSVTPHRETLEDLFVRDVV